MSRILIADDASFMRQVLLDILTKAGYQVVGQAEDGAQVVELYSKLKPDLVIMDINMPGLGGIEAVKAIKRIDPSAKIIMCSAMGHEKMVIEAIKAGALDFVVKPFQPERVVQAVKKALSQ